MSNKLKKVGLGLLAAVIVLVAVLLINTITFTSKQKQVEPVAPVALDEVALAERLSAAIKIKTISDGDPAAVDQAAFAAFREHLKASFPKVHETLRRETVAKMSLLYTWEGKDKGAAPIMLLAHQDVVPVEAGTEGDWIHDPFGGVVAEGFVWGRGAMDDKCGVMGVLEAVEHLIGAGFVPERTVYLGFGHDEEVGGKGAIAMAALLKSRGVTLEFLLDEGLPLTEGLIPGIEGPVALVGIAEKGYLSVSLSVEMEGGHASTPSAQTAVGLLSKAVYDLETHQMPARLDGAAAQMFDVLGREMPFGQRLAFANLWLLEPIIVGQLTGKAATNALVRTTTAPTMFEGSPQDNVLSAKAKAVINFRILPGDSIESVLAHVEQTIDEPRIKVGRHGFFDEPSSVSDVGSRAFEVVETATRQVYPEAMVAPGLFIAAADARHFEAVADTIMRYMPQRLTPEDRVRFHGTNERIAVADYANLVRFYRQVVVGAVGPR